MEELWEKAVESALGDEDFSSARSLTLDGAVKCVHGRLPPPSLLEKFCHLKQLSIANVGVSSLADFPRLKHLEKLTLSDNRIAGGLEFLVKAGLESLRDLDLSNNKIQFLDDLAPLAQLKLVSLDLYECPVTRVSNYRARVFGMIKSLKYLDKTDVDENERPESDEDDESDEEEEEDKEILEMEEEEEVESEEDEMQRRARRSRFGKMDEHETDDDVAEEEDEEMEDELQHKCRESASRLGKMNEDETDDDVDEEEDEEKDELQRHFRENGSHFGRMDEDESDDCLDEEEDEDNGSEKEEDNGRKNTVSSVAASTSQGTGVNSAEGNRGVEEDDDDEDELEWDSSSDDEDDEEEDENPRSIQQNPSDPRASNAGFQLVSNGVNSHSDVVSGVVRYEEDEEDYGDYSEDEDESHAFEIRKVASGTATCSSQGFRAQENVVFVGSSSEDDDVDDEENGEESLDDEDEQSEDEGDYIDEDEEDSAAPPSPGRIEIDGQGRRENGGLAEDADTDDLEDEV
eukprot:TRINITY_DN5189_c0_g1_i2.p1 TRINITY_DN5189_c0_g1~~TRINITY_DN5189_c0_g1_i2.p1  ORF type:complete len:516 (+),score=205.83 TRINITY_DN5189_c0_g1_i2:194-1741(+)